MNIPSVSTARIIRLCAVSAAIVMASGEMAQAQMPLGTQDLEIVSPPSGGRFLRWQRKAGRTYFIQVSTQEAPLAKWTFLPLIEYGPDSEVTFEIAATAPSAFFRLKYTDDPIPAGETPETMDFDNDGISNIAELLNYQPDGPLDPLEPDTDGDGTLDGIERALHTRANDASSRPPDAEWAVLTGDLPEDETKHLTRTVTLPAGRACLVFVAVASEEFSEWTEDSSKFNDTLAWNVTTSGGGTAITGSLNVNSRHAAWLQAQADGVSIQGHCPAHIETSRVLQAPATGPLTLSIALSATNIGDDVLPSTVMVGVIPISMMDVSFSGDKYWELWSDKGDAFAGGVTYSAPHWVDGGLDGQVNDPAAGDRYRPVAFTRATTPKLAARLYMAGLPPGLAPRIKATGPGAVAIPATALQGGSFGIWELPPTPSSGLLPVAVKYHSAQEPGMEFRLAWEIAFGTEGEFGIIRDTDHTVYVTYADPRDADGPTADFRETLFNIGCRNADGLSNNNNNALVDAIYGEFTDQQVHRVIPSQGLRENEVLHYWKDWDTDTPERGDLLATDFHNGNCGSWADLLTGIIRAQGIKASSVRIESKAYANDEGLLVKNWHFVPPGTSGNSTYPFTRGQDAVALQSIPAQGHDAADPGGAQAFNLHIITVSGGYLYDPSYGSTRLLPLNGESDYRTYENTYLDGFYWHDPVSKKDLARPNNVSPSSPIDVEPIILPPFDP